MADVSDLLECRWGEIRLFAAQVHTDGGRTQVVHELSSGDSHPVQDRGLRVRRVRCRVQFDEFPGAPSPRDAALALEAAKNSGRTAIFQHPLYGRFLASVGEFNTTIDEHSVVSTECEFVQEEPDIAVTPTGAASSGTSGESSVAAAAQALDAELAAAGQLKMSGATLTALASRLPFGAKLLATIGNVRGTIDLGVNGAAGLATGIISSVKAAADSLSSQASSILSVPSIVDLSLRDAAQSVSALADFASPFADPSKPSDPTVALASAASEEAAAGQFAATTIDARVAIASWNTGDVPTRQIMIDAARISNNIAVMIEVGGFEDDLALHSAFRAAIMLGAAVRDAAIAATSETPAVFVMKVLQPTALLPLAARIYGGAEAPDRARQIMALNDISTPGWLPPGKYLLPVRPAPAPF
jgi:hypothetical protein